MSRAVFVDASAWIAITNRRDDYHFVAQELYRELLAEKTPLFTTTWVAYEALSLIKSRMGYKKTLELWEVLNNQRLVKLVAGNFTLIPSCRWRYPAFRPSSTGRVPPRALGCS
ncbi:hypothetical protein MTAT_23540 [Moorella thermoacetica]|uniref:PIN domain-containing protein n=1 Tax=Neomoorella thermoacetica TaxID=1525 RepID=A0AAC9MU66_NEOTH|nr:PIN domain-containing protein [Moorella thermoacetica]AOQ24403.1 hypothetical protein Maut_01966 [Moorella thermoacetica]TYL11090.1 hypothetical protein MTAT_23540 [Moorella thermoacetica]